MTTDQPRRTHPSPTHPSPTIDRTLTIVALLALTALSYYLSRLALGAWEPYVAIAIAVVKASLILFIFMELRHERTTIRLIALVAPTFVALMLSFMVADILTRTPAP